MRMRITPFCLLVIFFAGCLSVSDFGESMKKKKVTATSYEIECKFDTKTLAELEKDRSILFTLEDSGITYILCNGKKIVLCLAGEEINLPANADLYFVASNLRSSGIAIVNVAQYMKDGAKASGIKFIYECLKTTN